jgi:hypothetical protein
MVRVLSVDVGKGVLRLGGKMSCRGMQKRVVCCGNEDDCYRIWREGEREESL